MPENYSLGYVCIRYCSLALTLDRFTNLEKNAFYRIKEKYLQIQQSIDLQAEDFKLSLQFWDMIYIVCILLTQESWIR